jgi:tetratricopeptide (TPR) repeat protein
MKSCPNSKEREGLLHRAHAAFARALELVPCNSYNHANLGRIRTEMVREKLANPDDAFAAWDRALALDRNNAGFYAEAANNALALGDLERAERYAAQGLERYPDFGPLIAIPGYAALQRGRLHRAIRRLEAALAGDWHGDDDADCRAGCTLVSTLIRVQRYSDAYHRAFGMADRWPDRPDPWCLLGETQERLGLREEAIITYQHIAMRWTEQQAALKALQRLSGKPLAPTSGERGWGEGAS